MMGTPWLSVIMPVYNGVPFLASALDGLVEQGEDGVEVIAVDDGSTDETLAMLRGYTDRVDLQIVEQGRLGNWVAGTMHGLSQARGDHVCLLHQDDYWLPGRLSVLRPLVTAPSPPVLVAHSCWFVDADGRRVGSWRCPLPAGRALPAAFVLEHLLVQNFLPLPGVTFSRRAALDVGGMDERLWFTADWDLWLKLAARGTTYYLDKQLAAYRIHADQLTVTGTTRPGEIRAQLEAAVKPHLERWRNTAAGPHAVENASRFSIDVNESLAALANRQPAHVGTLLAHGLKLGPDGWRRYLRDSRILERAGARVRAGLSSRHLSVRSAGRR